MAENLADGIATADEIRNAQSALEPYTESAEECVQLLFGDARHLGLEIAWRIPRIEASAIELAIELSGSALGSESPEAAEARLAALCADFVRDVFGNVYSPVAFDPAWRTDTAVSLARQMYDAREFGAMPILADALQDAGCEDEQVLNHCRDANQVHVRGCWVCDLVLGFA